MIRIILTLLLIIFTYVMSFAQQTHSVTVNFTGMKSNSGKLFVALYNTKDSFLKEPYKSLIVDINELQSTAVFKDLPEGEYAISSFHDENDNKKMDTKIFGIPKEAVGTSNDAKGFMGPPKYKNAKFKVDGDKTLQIKVTKIF